MLRRLIDIFNRLGPSRVRKPTAALSIPSPDSRQTGGLRVVTPSAPVAVRAGVFHTGPGYGPSPGHFKSFNGGVGPLKPRKLLRTGVELPFASHPRINWVLYQWSPVIGSGLPRTDLAAGAATIPTLQTNHPQFRSPSPLNFFFWACRLPLFSVSLPNVTPEFELDCPHPPHFPPRHPSSCSRISGMIRRGAR